MDVAEFWNLVDGARNTGGSDLDSRVEGLRKLLAPLPPSELQSFQNHYDEMIEISYRWDLWAAAYIINGGCSDDGFHYFRDWLISEGRATFEAALKDPESLAALPRVELADNESFGYVATKLYEKSGKEELDRSFATEGVEPAGEPWDEDTVYELFPKLAAKYA